MNLKADTEYIFKTGNTISDDGTIPLKQVQEIVRCKECKRWGQHDIDVPGETDNIKVCEWAMWMIGENGYCAYGERKGGDEW